MAIKTAESPSQLLVVGGGEHARVVIDTARLQGWTVIGFVDPMPCDDTIRRTGAPRLGSDADVRDILDAYAGTSLVLGVGGDLDLRQQVVHALAMPSIAWATVIHPDVSVSGDASIGRGAVVLSRAVLQTGVVLGDHAVINSGAIVEHDCNIGPFTHIAPGAIMGGSCRVEEKCFVGLGARVRDHVTVKRESTIGTGAVVVSNVPEGETVVGVPARRISPEPVSEISGLCVSPEATLRDAITAMGKQRLSVALVTDSDQRLEGILTDGDLHRLLMRSTDLDTRISEVMNRNYLSVHPSAGRIGAIDLMHGHGVLHIPVVDENKRLVALHMANAVIGPVTIPNTVVIMAGGYGQRLAPATDSVPKPMVRVAGRPILEHVIFHLIGHRIRNIYISIHHLGNVIEKYFGDGTTYGCDITYLREDAPLGTAGGLGLLNPLPDDPILVVNGDLITQFSVERLLAEHVGSNNTITVGVRDHIVHVPFGVINCDDKTVINFEEKPERHFLINAGVYVVDPVVITRMAKNGACMMTDLMQDCLGRDERVGTHFIDGDWIDVGRMHDLEAARGL